jgi:hypothetical protein
MKKSYLMVAISMALVQGCYTAPPHQSSSHVAVGMGYPGVNIGINYSTYPDFVRIPGYPVYYAPRVDSNYFFYDGLYWVFQSDNWYVSSWYNGPWDSVGYYDVPAYVLRVPVRYYRQPPPYFRGWRADAPPRWGDHWGRDWEQRRSGWDRWDRAAAPAPAPLPTYQRNYSGDRYPRAVEQQHTIRSENYRYQPREPVTQQHFNSRMQQDQRQQEQRQQEQRQQDQRQQEQRQQEQRQQDQRQQDQRQQDQRQQDQRQQDQRQQEQRQQEQRQQDQRQQDQQRKAASEKQAAEKQQVERKRQVEQQQEQRQRDVRQKQQQAVEKQPAGRDKRQAQTQQARQAECERLAIEQHRDPRQCQSEDQPKAQPGNRNRDNSGK